MLLSLLIYEQLYFLPTMAETNVDSYISSMGKLLLSAQVKPTFETASADYTAI